MIKVEMLSTGDEVLHGQIVDTNAAWLADYLFSQGVPLTRRNTVGDRFDDLVAVLRERSLEADILIVNGGLGPTSDDLSAQAAASAADVELLENAEWLSRMARFFSDRGRVMAPANRKQALLPAGSEMLDNPVGTACGFAMSLNRCLMLFTPGVPSEFKVMVQQQIMPLLRQRFTLPEPPLCLRLTTFGRGESDLAQQLDSLVLPPEVVLGYRASMPIVELKLTGPGSRREQMIALWPQVQCAAGESLIFEGSDDLAVQIARRLGEQGVSLAVSEGLSGGELTRRLSLAQAPLRRGEVLPSEEETLAETVKRSVTLCRSSGADLALIVGGTREDRVNFALATETRACGLGVIFNINRHELPVRQQVYAIMALDILRRWLNGQPLDGDRGWIRIQETLSLTH